MLIEIIKTIALLCPSQPYNTSFALKCQKYYIECIRKKEILFSRENRSVILSDESVVLLLEQCILEK